MDVKDQKITENYALYNSDCMKVIPSLPSNSVDFSIYSPPFCGLYNYSSSPNDMSNCVSYQQFFEQYGFLVGEIARITKPGRCTVVHCTDIPGRGNGDTATMGCGANAGTGLIDFPGDIIRCHEKHGFHYAGRRVIWKEPLGVRLRTMAKGLAHKQIVDDSVITDVASADYVLTFRKSGENKVPVSHERGLLDYAGSKSVPSELQDRRGYDGKQTENFYSHWIWRRYASSIWDDIRGCDGTEPKDDSIREKGVLPYKEIKDPDDEKHCHPLQLDVIDRCIELYSNPNEVVLTPFLGVGSEAYTALIKGRRAIGVELKTTYYKQAVYNCDQAIKSGDCGQSELGFGL